MAGPKAPVMGRPAAADGAVSGGTPVRPAVGLSPPMTAPMGGGDAAVGSRMVMTRVAVSGHAPV